MKEREKGRAGGTKATRRSGKKRRESSLNWRNSQPLAFGKTLSKSQPRHKPISPSGTQRPQGPNGGQVPLLLTHFGAGPSWGSEGQPEVRVLLRSHTHHLRLMVMSPLTTRAGHHCPDIHSRPSQSPVAPAPASADHLCFLGLPAQGPPSLFSFTSTHSRRVVAA